LTVQNADTELARALDALFPTLGAVTGAEDRFAYGFAVEQ